MKWAVVLGVLACVSGLPASATVGLAVDRDADVVAFLRSYLRPQSAPLEERALTATRLRIGWADLNGDGKPEALVYVSGEGICGSGGCSLLILERLGGTFRVRGDIGVSRLPVGVVNHRSHGWWDVTVLVAGGGILPGYIAELPFDGNRYASNPTVAPAHKLGARAATRVVISDDVYPFL